MDVDVKNIATMATHRMTTPLTWKSHLPCTPMGTVTLHMTHNLERKHPTLMAIRVGWWHYDAGHNSAHSGRACAVHHSAVGPTMDTFLVQCIYLQVHHTVSNCQTGDLMTDHRTYVFIPHRVQPNGKHQAGKGSSVLHPST